MPFSVESGAIAGLFVLLQQDWEQSLPAVQAYTRVESLEARLTQTSTSSKCLPSSDPPAKRARQSMVPALLRKAVGQLGHPRSHQPFCALTETGTLTLERCTYGTIDSQALTPCHAMADGPGCRCCLSPQQELRPA
jgi:hypothetical protein